MCGCMCEGVSVCVGGWMGVGVYVFCKAITIIIKYIYGINLSIIHNIYTCPNIIK